MKKNAHKISIIGDGGWGTTLAIHLAKQGFPVRLWGPFPEYVKRMAKNRYNARFLPGVRIPKDVILTPQLSQALEDADILVFAVPSQYATGVLKKIKATKIGCKKKIFLSVTKGVDTRSLLRISQMVKKELGQQHFAVLSGPTIAPEVAAGIPSTAVIASQTKSTAVTLQKIFNSDTFRIYTNSDVVGVELGGSIKNIIAIACGVCDGLGFGSNTKSAIVSRGLAEMSRLGKALGAKEKTFAGLSGLGDLVTTCFSPKSRNRSVGEKLGKGQSISHILGSMKMVAEGVETAKAVLKLSQKHKIPMPITEEVYNILYKHKSPTKAVANLMSRQVRSE